MSSIYAIGTRCRIVAEYVGILVPGSPTEAASMVRSLLGAVARGW